MTIFVNMSILSFICICNYHETKTNTCSILLDPSSLLIKYFSSFDFIESQYSIACLTSSNMEGVLTESERERLLPKKITSRRAMEFKERIKKVCRIKNVIISCLILLFLWCIVHSVLKYYRELLSTDISYRYGESGGDWGVGIQYPQITLCQPFIFLNHPIMKECHGGSWNFISTVVSCLKNNKTLKVADLIDNLHPEIGNIVEMVRFWTGSKYVGLWPLYEKVWTRVFIDVLGPCYTFDLSKVDKFKYVSLETGRPGVEFVMAEKNPLQTAKLLLHAKFDLPDAYQLRGYLPLSLSDDTKKVLKVGIQKKVNLRESTRKVPCVKYERRTCESIEKHQAIFKKFGCRIPILYSGQHLDNSNLLDILDLDIPTTLPNCSYDITLEVLNFYLNKGSNCSMTQTCRNTRYASSYNVEETWIENKTLIYVYIESPEVEYHNSYVSYGFYSFIGEIGGILGLTLGASAFTLSEFLLKHVPYY